MDREALKEAFQEYVGWMLPGKKELKEMAFAVGYVSLIYLLLWVASLFL